MQLYNALTRKIEDYAPGGRQTTIYVCGITPYDTTHLGHVFTYATFDVLIRYLEFSGDQVRYAQNVTDIDDDILRRSSRDGVDWLTLGNRWTSHFIDDNIALNIRPPDYFPRATDVIPDIVAVVQDLLSVGVAYESAGNVYFDVSKDPAFGHLSRLSYEQMLPIANERGNKPDDPNKHDPLDFVLWQAQMPGEPAWESPWGPGRPGWHIECSTMSAKFLDMPVDIHGGGADLLFPHHECEIAQAEKATNKMPFTRFWLHVAMVRHQGEKMSKSLGNLVMARDLLQAGWSADALRTYMSTHHYREPWSYSEADLAAAATIADALAEAISATGGLGEALGTESSSAAFRNAMDNDLDSPAAVRILTQLAEHIMDGSRARCNVLEAQATLRSCCAVLGLRLDNDGPEDGVTARWNEHKGRFA